ncbi:hypothetical protein [Liquorilactobacillus mali]|uniref:Uncharacterized protein n=1 Tax=Liquorilactobacillus mali KCTC 3596 = DSM 20444 TaxID=1046596 RepID=J1F608_9LACO|nr:hypothetical protein [Liquorilactobacillus mali]EJF02183.1 hypothetical protein LMA_10579 [Liquorilactobacillus mali KCTC 3596 = DSM 20444]KRN03487.1 hypothetical protein FD00_GL000501 [Liquorilactobacillus mali KCTC 3596 = DSM 20444]QFQ74555.1 hypothetical protein LM596_05235 [Liquorilactobacillus mali]
MSIEEYFRDESGTQVLVRINRSNIEIYGADFERPSFSIDKSKDILNFIYKGALSVWKDFKPREAFSEGSDYDEFYDKKTDNNGYLSVNNQKLNFSREYLQGKTLLWYRFNKAKCQSFIFDIKNMLEVSE